MKTQKFLLALTAIAALSMSSCTQEEELLVSNNNSFDDPNAVLFGTYASQAPQSRGAEMNLDALKTSGFGVYAYYTGTEEFKLDDKNDSVPNFMCNQQVTWASGAWTYTPVKYWPNNLNEKVSFFAYAPYREKAVAEGEAGITSLPSNETIGDPKIGYTIPQNVGDQLDLLYSGEKLDLIKENIDQKVIFDFNHAMTRIGFERVIETDEVDQDVNGGHDNQTNEPINISTGTTVTITKVSLASTEFYKSGELNLRTGKWDDLSKAAQTYTLTEDDFTNDGMNITPTNSSIKTKLNNEDKYLMIFPTGKDATILVEITVEYNVTTIDESLPNKKSQITSQITAPFKFAFEQGKYYNFVLRIGLTSVKLDVQTEGWNTTWSGSTNTEVVVNTPYNNTVTLIYDANRGKFANGSSQYIITSYVDNWKKEEGDNSGENDPKNTAKFIVKSFQDSDITPGESDREQGCEFKGWTEEPTELIMVNQLSGNTRYKADDPIFVTKTTNNASRTIYALWCLSEVWD